MLVYHGSDRNFSKLRISESLLNDNIPKEGLGIYFSTDIEVAKSYGKYIYTLDINHGYLIDFRKRTPCRLYLENMAKSIYKETGVNIFDYFDYYSIISGVYSSHMSVDSISKYITLWLGNNESFNQLPVSKIEKIYRLIRKYTKDNLKIYFFNESAKGNRYKNTTKIDGVIKDVSEGVVRIVNKKRWC